LEDLRAFTLKDEAEMREREAGELRLAEGAFPALSSSDSGGGSAAVGVRGGRERERRRAGGGGGLGHRVFLVDSRMKRVKVESYSRLGEEGQEEEGHAAGIEGTLSILQRVPRHRGKLSIYVHAQRGPATC